MAALPAGVQYGLSSESTNKENKELVFVKLTDSALKAIEDFIRNNRDKLAKPTIQFLPGNEGKISIPAPATSNGPTSEATFHFSINSNAEMEGPQGSFECVKSGGARRLESCGPLPRRMRVQANDDSYEATKDRMARTVAAEQSKCTRVIKPNQTDIGRRVKVRSSHPLYSSGPAATLERTERPERAERAERAERPDRPERPDRAERPERAERPPVPVPRAQPPPAPHQPHHPHQPHQLHQPSQPPPHPHQQQRPPTNPDLTRRSIKERLIQLLALKPFKKPELYLRLNQEGIKERERSLVNKILPQIGSLKDNCYHLRRHMWNDVNEDWPFYSEEEKRMLKRRKPQNLTPPVSSDSTNSLSPRASPGGKRPSAVSGVVIAPSADAVEPPASKKQRISHYRRPSPPSSGYATGSSGASSGERHASDNEDDRTNGQYPPTNPLSPRASPGGKRPVLESVEPVAAKKQRVSHCRRPSPQSSGYGTGSSGASSGERHASDNEDERTIVKKDNGYTLNFNTVKEICPSPVKTNGFRSSSPPAEQPSITDTHNITTNTETLENADLTSVPEENVTDLEEIERQYPPITSASTRRAYKNEFAELYTEYQSMYERVAQVAALFTRLEQQLKRAPPHSPHHQSIEQRIVDEYRRVRNDATYQAEKSRVNYLHRKLTHIKRMVQHYDQLRNLKSERVSTASTTQAY